MNPPEFMKLHENHYPIAEITWAEYPINGTIKINGKDHPFRTIKAWNETRGTLRRIAQYNLAIDTGSQELIIFKHPNESDWRIDHPATSQAKNW